MKASRSATPRAVPPPLGRDGAGGPTSDELDVMRKWEALTTPERLRKIQDAVSDGALSLEDGLRLAHWGGLDFAEKCIARLGLAPEALRQLEEAKRV